MPEIWRLRNEPAPVFFTLFYRCMVGHCMCPLPWVHSTPVCWATPPPPPYRCMAGHCMCPLPWVPSSPVCWVMPPPAPLRRIHPRGRESCATC